MEAFIEDTIGLYKDKMEKTIQNLQKDLDTVRAGRANPKVLDQIRVSYYGTMTPIQQLANVSVPEPRIIQIQPWEKNMIREIEKAINMSDLGINPTNDGHVIRLVFPELTEERRKDLSKDVRKKGEAAKVALRNIRRDANDAMKKMNKNNEITEDDQKDGETQIQKMTDSFVSRVDKIVDDKIEELMTV